MHSFVPFYRLRIKPYLPFAFYFLVTFLSLVIPAYAQVDSCNDIADIANIPDSWKTHFPFDLVYPIGDPYKSDGSCPTIPFWGVEHQVCSIPQITAIVKNVFLARVAISGLFYL